MVLRVMCRGLCGLLALLLSASCGRPSTDAAPLFVTEKAPPANPCRGISAQRVSFEVRASFVIGEGASLAPLKQVFEDARAYAKWQGIEIAQGEKKVAQSKRRILFKETRAELSDKNVEVADAMAQPLREELSSRTDLQPPSVDIFWFAELANHRSAAAGYINLVDGLTLSPFAGDVTMREALLLDTHRPSIFLSQAMLGKKTPEEAASTLVHELGHALGLVHQSDASLLMDPKRKSECDPIFSDDELDLMRDNAKDLQVAPR